MRYVVIQTILLVVLGVAWSGGFGPELTSIERAPDLVVSSLRWIGLALGFLAVFLVGVSYRSLRRVFQAAPGPRPDGQLITAGIYGKFRHPMYTAAVLGAIGLFLTRSTVFVGGAALLVILFYVIKARHEERLLRRTYPGYAEYMMRTQGVLPTFRR